MIAMSFRPERSGVEESLRASADYADDADGPGRRRENHRWTRMDTDGSEPDGEAIHRFRRLHRFELKVPNSLAP